MDKIAIKNISAIANSHACYDENKVFKHYVAFINWKKTTVSVEEKEQAIEQLKILKQKRIEQVGNTLTFVGMGMEHTLNDVGNYRIRTNIQRRDWRKFFVELSGGENMTIDFIVDKDLQEQKDAEMKKLLTIPRDRRDKKRFNDFKIAQEQPHYQYKKEKAMNWVEWKKMNKKNVLDFVNFVFGTRFTDIEIENTLLTTDDYTSKDL